MEILVALITALITSLATTFMYDRFGWFLFSKKCEREAIHYGPQIEITEIAPNGWVDCRKDSLNYLIMMTSFCKEQNNLTIENVIWNFKLLQETDVIPSRILRMRILNNTVDGISIHKMIYHNEVSPNLQNWSHRSVDPNSNLSLHIETASRPDEIQIVYKGHILIYQLKALRTGFIRADKAKLQKNKFNLIK